MKCPAPAPDRHDLTLATGVVLSALVLALAMIPALMGCPTAQGHNDLLAALELSVWLGMGWTFHGGTLATPRHGATNIDTLISLGSSVAHQLAAHTDHFLGRLDQLHELRYSIQPQQLNNSTHSGHPQP